MFGPLLIKTRNCKANTGIHFGETQSRTAERDGPNGDTPYTDSREKDGYMGVQESVMM